ncbi:MAG TPA: helix-turn-helix transcriptional regulator [Phycisphaerales bacterium]|nr:helix-turn-helix transcriptional regulator [Phycisphaerales bacterium]
MPIEQTGGRGDQTIREVKTLVDRASALGASLARLPAVAAPDLCRRAADALARVVDDGDAVVALARVDGAGRIARLESIGVASRAGAQRAAERGSDLRLGVESLAGLEPSPERAEARGDGVTHCAAASLGEHERVWRMRGRGALTAGVGVLPRGPADRRVLVYLAAGAEPADARSHALLVATATRLITGVLADALRGSGEVIEWLTPREQEVLDMLILGRTVKEISEELHRSQHTIHDHVKSLHRKLDAKTRGELIARTLGYRSN